METIIGEPKFIRTLVFILIPNLKLQTRIRTRRIISKHKSLTLMWALLGETKEDLRLEPTIAAYGTCTM